MVFKKGQKVKNWNGFKKGYIPWNKGKRYNFSDGIKNSELYLDRNKRISDKLTGRKLSKNTKEKLRKITKKQFQNGMSEKTKIKISESLRGEKSHLWKGGITELVYNIRNSLRYRTWRNLIFIRDKYTCQECGETKKELNAHHKKSFSLILKENNIQTFEEAMSCQELWDLNNGETLCIDCHKKTDNYLIKAQRQIERISIIKSERGKK